VTKIAPDSKDGPSGTQTILSTVFVVVMAVSFGFACAYGVWLAAIFDLFCFLLHAVILGEGLGQRAALRAGLTPVPSPVYRTLSKWPWEWGTR
jgi:hypothetical protein